MTALILGPCISRGAVWLVLEMCIGSMVSNSRKVLAGQTSVNHLLVLEYGLRNVRNVVGKKPFDFEFWWEIVKKQIRFSRDLRFANGNQVEAQTSNQKLSNSYLFMAMLLHNFIEVCQEWSMTPFGDLSILYHFIEDIYIYIQDGSLLGR